MNRLPAPLRRVDVGPVSRTGLRPQRGTGVNHPHSVSAGFKTLVSPKKRKGPFPLQTTDRVLRAPPKEPPTGPRRCGTRFAGGEGKPLCTTCFGRKKGGPQPMQGRFWSHDKRGPPARIFIGGREGSPHEFLKNAFPGPLRGTGSANGSPAPGKNHQKGPRSDFKGDGVLGAPPHGVETEPSPGPFIDKRAGKRVLGASIYGTRLTSPWKGNHIDPRNDGGPVPGGAPRITPTPTMRGGPGSSSPWP